MLTSAETDAEMSNDWVETEPLVRSEPAPCVQVTLTELPEVSVAQTVAGSAVRGLKPGYRFSRSIAFQG